MMKLKVSYLILFISFFSVCNAQTTATAKRISSVTVDGNSREWETPFGLYETKTQLRFAIANNDSMLFLCFQCPDPNNQDKITRAGMKVGITQKGKKKLDASIIFPLKKEVKKKNNNDDYAEEQSPYPLTREFFLLNNGVMLTDGFTTQNGKFPVNAKSGIQISMNWDSIKTMVYEIAIPFRELFGANYSPEDLRNEFKLFVEIYPLIRPDHENFNITGLSSNNAGSVVNSGAMQQYGGMGGTQNGYNQGNMNGMGMNPNGTQIDPTNGGMAGLNGNPQQAWNTSNPPQYTDISGMFDRAEMKQKFVLAPKQ